MRVLFINRLAAFPRVPSPVSWLLEPIWNDLDGNVSFIAFVQSSSEKKS